MEIFHFSDLSIVTSSFILEKFFNIKLFFTKITCDQQNFATLQNLLGHFC